MPPIEDDPRPIEWVSREIIQRFFNENQYAEKALIGEFTTKMKRNSHCKTPPEGEPSCTHSQIEYYYDQSGEPVAIVHQYRRPDGSLAGSGKPDPKRIFLPDRIISLKVG